MIHYDMAIAVAAINRRINLQGRNTDDPWAETQVDTISRIYDRDPDSVKQDIVDYFERQEQVVAED